MPYIDYDFIGFTYNGKHSIKDLKIYRTSNSGRYEINLKPNTTEKTASVDGQIGQYYFGTKIDSLNLTVPFAFEDLSESELLELKRVFSGDGLHELVFDEMPYKAYTAKVTSSAVVKHLCFENNEVRHYRGEGSIQFTCYYPYARSREDLNLPYRDSAQHKKTITICTYEEKEEIDEQGEKKTYYKIIPNETELTCGLFIKGGEIINVGAVEEGAEVPKGTSITKTFIDKRGKIVEDILEANELYYLKSISFVLPTRCDILPDGVSGVGAYKKTSVHPKITISNQTYYYGQNNCFEFIPTDDNKYNGQILNHYSIMDFPTKQQWGFACGLPLHTSVGQNCGERPVPFKLTYSLTTDLSKGAELGFNNHKITLGADIPRGCDLIWDSKLGTLVKSTDGGKTQVLIPYSGEGCVNLPENEPGANWTLLTVSGITPTLTLRYEYL